MGGLGDHQEWSIEFPLTPHRARPRIAAQPSCIEHLPARSGDASRGTSASAEHAQGCPDSSIGRGGGWSRSGQHLDAAQRQPRVSALLCVLPAQEQEDAGVSQDICAHPRLCQMNLELTVTPCRSARPRILQGGYGSTMASSRRGRTKRGCIGHGQVCSRGANVIC